MRLLVSAILATLVIFGVGNHAAAVPPVSQVEVINQPISVEVTNEPVAVEVINPPTASPPARWQLVGFTSAAYTGAMGGVFGVTSKCQLEYPESRMCNRLEAVQTTAIPDSLSGVAWLNSFAGAGQSCQDWSSVGASDTALTITASGALTRPNLLCSDTASIACCALVP